MLLTPRAERESAGRQRTEVRGLLASPNPCRRWSMKAGRNGHGRDRGEVTQQHMLRRRRAEPTQPRETQSCARATSQLTTAAHHNGSHESMATPMWTNIGNVVRVGANHASAHVATNQPLKAYQRMTVPRGQSVRRDDTAPKGAAEEKTAPSGASAAAMGVDGVSFRFKALG